MTFDIIDIGEQEAESLPSVKLKLLRTAQQKKNELYHKLQQQIAEYRRITLSNNVFDSTLCGAVEKELTEEYEYQVDILICASRCQMEALIRCTVDFLRF